MSIWLEAGGAEGKSFSVTINSTEYEKLPDQEKLLIALGLVRSPSYSSFLDDEGKVTEFLLRMTNRGIGVDEIIDEEGLKTLIDRAAKDRLVGVDENDPRPRLTVTAIDHLRKRVKRKGSK